PPPRSAPRSAPRAAPASPKLSPEPSDVGEELSLGPSDASAMRSAFDDSDRAIPNQSDALGGPNMAGALAMDGGPRGSVGDEVELTSEASGLEPAAMPARVEQPRIAATEAPAKRSNSRRIAVGALVLLAVGGAALSFDPSIGPFAINLIQDQWHAKDYA